MTDYMIDLTDEILTPLGFTLGTPRNPERRGSHVSLRHPEGYRINRALIDEMNVIPDFREPDNIRFGLAPLYTTFGDIWQTVERVRIVMLEKRYEKYPRQRLTVT
jgi:kynureninase